ncbi:MAG: hypothetical protein K2X08_07270 [Chlamydiales bacterium]|nr:hypothetical protein [Chlamydiales bacterium]
MSCLLNGIATAIRVSPYYVFVGITGSSFIIDDFWKDRELSTASKIGLIQSGLCLLGMRLHLVQYRHIVELLQRKGYRSFHLDPYLKSFCGRQIVSRAAKDTQMHHLYKQHVLDRAIKWYQFEPNPILNIVHPLGVFTCAGAAAKNVLFSKD